MIVVDIHAAVLLTALAIYCIVRAVRAFAIVREVMQREARTVATMSAGRLELHGTIHAVDASAVTDATGAPCILARTVVESFRGVGKSSQSLGSQRGTRIAQRIVLRDASGECELDLARAEVDGEIRFGTYQADSARSCGVAAIASLVDDEATGVRVSEATVRDGAHVVVTGNAREIGREPGDAGYRDARTRWIVASEGDARLILSVGTEGAFLRRAAWPGILFALLAVAAAGHAFLAIAAVRAQL